MDLAAEAEVDETETGQTAHRLRAAVALLLISVGLGAVLGLFLLPKAISEVWCWRERNRGIHVDGLAGLTLAEARERVDDASECLELRVVGRRSDPTVPEGLVLEPGSNEIVRSETVPVVLSAGRDSPVVPFPAAS